MFYQGVNNTYVGDSVQIWDINSGTWKDNSAKKHRIDISGDLVSTIYKFPNSQSGILENVSLDTTVYNNFHQPISHITGLAWDNNSGTFVQASDWAEHLYYYQQFTQDVASIAPGITALKLFPSPAQTNITIQATFETPEAFKIQVYDMQGRLVFQNGEKPTKKFIRTIRLHELSSGNYILQLKGAKTTAQQKFTLVK